MRTDTVKANSTAQSRSLAKHFPASLVRTLAQPLTIEANAESAIPSYTHWNPAIRWLMFRRLDVIREMALQTLGGEPPHPGATALDYGCGIGMMIPALAGSVETLYLSDEQLVPARATVARFEMKNVVCVPPEFVGTHIADRSLNVIIAADVLEHVDDLPTLVDTLRRKLRSGGALIVSGPTENWLYRLGRAIAGFSGDYHVRSVFEVEDTIRNVPLALEQLRHLPFAVGPTLFRITLWRRND
jgi:ubiquinone/menaquinone biosynthesis C-methylase UbiE